MTRFTTTAGELFNTKKSYSQAVNNYNLLLFVYNEKEIEPEYNQMDGWEESNAVQSARVVLHLQSAAYCEGFEAKEHRLARLSLSYDFKRFIKLKAYI
jgi:hypothetical protein